MIVVLSVVIQCKSLSVHISESKQWIQLGRESILDFQQAIQPTIMAMTAEAEILNQSSRRAVIEM